VASMGEERKLYKVSARIDQKNRVLGRPRRRWEDGIGMYLREIGWGRYGVERGRWRAVMNAVMNPRLLAPRS
jgi:hypothetical protein